MANKSKGLYIVFIFTIFEETGSLGRPQWQLFSTTWPFEFAWPTVAFSMSQFIFTEKVMLNHHVLLSISRVSLVCNSKTKWKCFYFRILCWKKLDIMRVWWLPTNNGDFEFTQIWQKKNRSQCFRAGYRPFVQINHSILSFVW